MTPFFLLIVTAAAMLLMMFLPTLWELFHASDQGPRQFLQLPRTHKLYVMSRHVLSRCKDEAFCDVCGKELEVGDTVVSVKSGRDGRKFYCWGNPSSPSCYRKIYPIDREFVITARE